MSVDSKKMETVIKPRSDGMFTRLRKTLSTVESPAISPNGVSSTSNGSVVRRPSAPLRFVSCPHDTEISPTSPGEEPSRWRAAIGGPRSPGGIGEQIELNLFRRDQDVCHLFDPVDLDRLAWCDYCAGHIWGLGSKACHRCRYCQLTCHLHCCDLVNVPCITASIEDQIKHDPLSEWSNADNEVAPTESCSTSSKGSAEGASPVVIMRRGPSSRMIIMPPGGPVPRFSFLHPATVPTAPATVATNNGSALSTTALVSVGGGEEVERCTSGRLTYDFSSLDRDSIKQFDINVDEDNSAASTPCKEGLPHFENATWTQSKEKLMQSINVFNLNDQGLFVKLSDKGHDCLGSLRVHINLIRPIKMLLTARPPSIYDVIGGEDEDGGGTASAEVGMSVLGMTSFRLPRGTTKLLHISSCTTAQRVISSLLRKFRINDNPHKFALYEHTIEGDKEVRVRKLADTECPLQLILSWAADGVKVLNATLEVKRIVLQENETGDIQWNAFTLPELNNFMVILAREEEEYRREIEMKHDLRRQEIIRLLNTEEKEQPDDQNGEHLEEGS